MQLPEAEPVGPVDDERVDRRHVDAGLDDRRADEHVVVAFPEVDHDLLEASLVHLAVGDRDPRLGDQSAKLRGDALDVLHPVVDVEDLALAQQLAPDRLGDGALVVLSDVGEDRLALRRRRGDQRQVPDAGQAHLERAGDRARREGQHVDADGQLLDGLLVRDPEALLLVDDEKAEPFETDVARQQAMGPDHDVDGPVGEPVDDLPRLGGGQETGQHLDPDRVGRVPVGEGLEVLLGQQRRRDQDGSLGSPPARP